MKAFAVPTITSGLAAGLSVLFFLGLSNRFGDAMLGHLILVQTAVALVQIALVPNCLVYLLGAPPGADTDARYREGIAIEWVGTLAGLAIVAIGQMLVGPRGEGAVMMFLSLATQASAATMGMARVRNLWRRYMLWILIPNLIRVPLVWALPLIAPRLGIPDMAGNRSAIIFTFFLLPDMARVALIYLPQVLRHFSLPGMAELRASARQIYRNWFFDVGSAATDQADKLFVGALFGPQVLVAYFFARRIGVITVMVTEPFYMELYRRRMTGNAAPGWLVIWGRGAMLALGLSVSAAILLAVLSKVPIAAQFLPNAVVLLMPMFAAVMVIDSLFAANRWSRFLAQVTNRAVSLLTVRLAAFGLFVLVAILMAPTQPVWGVVIALAAALSVEALYVRALASRAERT